MEPWPQVAPAFLKAGRAQHGSPALAYCPYAMTLPLKPLRALLLEMLGSHKRPAPCRAQEAHQESPPPGSLFSVWLASRTFHGPDGAVQFLAPGAQRPLSRTNLQFALHVLQRCSLQLAALLWSLHPFRLVVMVALDVCRGILPAFRGYSQALIIDEASQLTLLPSDVLR